MTGKLFDSGDLIYDGQARTGLLRFTRPSGPLLISTPVFMPVGTRATVKALWHRELEEMGYDLILANTYHLFLRPGHETIAALGGLHDFQGWSEHAILTDSGGYQVFSLADRVRFFDEGVEFQSHVDGARHLFTPELVLDVQCAFGSDIMMMLDDCPPADADRVRLQEALRRTHLWCDRVIEHRRQRIESGAFDQKRQSLFGIFQGGLDRELRERSMDYIAARPFDGIAIGGLSVGESRPELHAMLEWLGSRMDPERPRYLMGVGTVPDILEAVRAGVDMFDCVLPTRNARNGQFLTGLGKRNVRNARFARSDEPPDPECTCPVCARYSLGYIRHLFSVGEMLGPMLATHHNLHFFSHFMEALRAAIKAGEYEPFYERWKKIPF